MIDNEILIKNHKFGIKQYCYNNCFTKEDKNSMIYFLDKEFFDCGRIEKDRPKFQTDYNYNIIEYDPFIKLKTSFMNACEDYIENEEYKNRLKNNEHCMMSWSYMNWVGSGFEVNRSLHAHNPHNINAISGIFYLNLPKNGNDSDYELTCTEMFIACNRFRLPPEEFCWFLYPSNFYHIPGKTISSEKRYSIAVDIWFKD